MLTIDIGNSAIKLSEFDNAHAVRQANVPLGGNEMLSAVSSFVDNSLMLSRRVERMPVAVAGVVPAAEAKIAGLLSNRVKLRPVWLNAHKRELIAADLPDLASTGVDRLLAARAARELHAARGGAAVVVIQAGTGTTVDLVDAGGVFRGGFILPGPKLWLCGLGQAAAVPEFDPTSEEWGCLRPGATEEPGKSTRAAVLRGLGLGWGGAVTRAAEALRGAAGGEPLLVLTGGWAERLSPALGPRAVLDPLLVAHGMRLAAVELLGEGEAYAR